MTKLTVDIIVEDIVKDLKKSKGKFILIEDFPSYLTELINKKYGKFVYKSEIGIAVKKILREHESILIYRESDNVYNSNGACTITRGEYFVIAGIYRDVVEMKEKNGIVPMFFKRKEDVLSWERGEITDDEYAEKY